MRIHRIPHTLSHVHTQHTQHSTVLGLHNYNFTFATRHSHTSYTTNSPYKMPYILLKFVIVPDPSKRVCADPVNRGAILEGEGQGPPSRDKERQLSPVKGRGKT